VVIRRLAAVLAVGVVVAACGSPASGASPSSGTSAGAGIPPVAIRLVAQGVELTPAAIHVPAGSPLSVTVDNRDAGIPHGIQLQADTAPPTVLATGQVITGPATDRFEVPGMMAGSYRFICQVHPNMV